MSTFIDEQWIAKTQALLQQAQVAAQPSTDADVTDEEILQFTIEKVKEGKTDAEIRSALLEEFEDVENDANDFISKAHAAEKTKRLIRKFERENKELEPGVADDIEISLQEFPTDASDEEKLQVLKENNRLLVDAINNPNEQPKKPKFGSGLAVSMSFMKNGEIKDAWVDQNQIDVDTGERYEFSPELKQQHLKLLEETRKEKANEAVAALDRQPEPHSYYAMTKEEYERESEKDYPVYVLPKQPGPAWDDSILYGPAGEVIRKASQYNESHPAGMLVDFLVSLGSIIGRGPYFNINETSHYTNEFMARVGDSSKSRKGTGRDAIDGILKLVDPDWYSNRIESGFGSGEAIISRVRDPIVETKLDFRTGKANQIVVPGVQDKRLCIREGELASIFVLAGKPESRADIVLRDGWDGKPLRNLVKGKSKEGLSNSAKCEQPHLSISGDTTIHELRQKMPTGADENGFGNRFLYVYVYRVKDCPQGGPAIDWSREIVSFLEVVRFARTVKHVSMTNQARKWWNKKYSDLEHHGPDGLAGKMTRRAAAHIRRIAMLYALIDLKDQIELEHFQAAEKLWAYCEESAMFIFGGMTKEQLRIVQWIGQRGPSSYQQVRDDLYYRNKPVAEIRADLDSLVRSGHLSVKAGLYAAR